MIYRFVKELGKAIIVGTAIFLVFILIYFFQGSDIGFDENLLMEYVVNLIYSIILYMANMYVFRYFYCKHKTDLYTSSHLVPAIASGIITTLIGIFIARLVHLTVFYNKSFSDFIAEEKIGYYWVSFIIAMVVTAIFYAFFYYRYKKERQVKEQKIIAGTASAQFDALKNQLDPHFLFNSLNVLTSLIEENPDHAQKFTTSLSKVYRYVLEQKNKELVTVDEEFAFAKTYMNLIKMRYEDSIVFSIPEKSSNPEAKVVPLSLQLLLENAVKHNRVTPNDKLKIEILEENNNLVVRNNLQTKQVIKKSSGVGLQNIYQRYQLLTKRKVLVEKTAEYFSVSLPMLTKITQVMSVSESFISDKKYARAKEHVEKLKGFYANFGMYLIAVPFFIYFNIVSTSFPWALFPIGGWGMGVAFHAAEVFNWNPLLGKQWEERKIKELMDEDKHL